MTVGEMPTEVSEKLIEISTEMMGAMIRQNWDDANRHMDRYNRVYNEWWQRRKPPA